MKHIKGILKVWGWFCLGFAFVYIGQDLYAAANPNVHSALGSTGLGEWVGMGLISLGLARVIELLEKK